MYTTGAGVSVSCLTDNNDGTITLRLAPARTSDPKVKVEREIVLAEPTGREYARLRTMIVNADRGMQERFPMPDPPTINEPDEPTEADKRAAQKAMQDYTREITKWRKDRKDYERDEEHPVYAACVIEAAKILAGQDLTLDDLTVDAFDITTCGALLELWEAPLGGPVVPPNLLADAAEALAAARDVPELPTAPTEPDSPESEPSSLPGTEPATQSLPEKSTV
jgi:hypothetical protein